MADKDNFDDLNHLWGDGPPPPDDPGDFGSPDDADDDDDGEGDGKKKRKKKREPAPSSRFGGVDFLPMASALPAPDGKDRPPTDPLKWKVFKERFGFLPYPTPLDEFLQNSHTLNLQTLLYRWQGVLDANEKPIEGEIYRFWYDPETPAKRARAQSQRMRSMGLPDPLDKESMRIENAYQAALVVKRIRYLEFILDTNCVPTTEQLFIFAEGGTVVREEMRPLSQAARSKADNDLTRLIETYRMLTGQVLRTTKTEMDSRVEMTVSVRDNFVNALKEVGHKTVDGYAFSELIDGDIKALPAPGVEPRDPFATAIEGEIIYDGPNMTREMIEKMQLEDDYEQEGEEV